VLVVERKQSGEDAASHGTRGPARGRYLDIGRAVLVAARDF
jgi:hypothetical protein